MPVQEQAQAVSQDHISMAADDRSQSKRDDKSPRSQISEVQDPSVQMARQRAMEEEVIPSCEKSKHSDEPVPE